MVVKIVSLRIARAVTAPLKIQILLMMLTFAKVFVVLTAVSHVETVGVTVAGELILLQLHRVALHQGKLVKLNMPLMR